MSATARRRTRPTWSTRPPCRNGFVTFGCFNNLAKITPRVIANLGRHPAPGADRPHDPEDPPVLATAPPPSVSAQRFAALGIAADRIELRGSSGHRAFMGEYGDVDIVLDPFPYSGGLTTCEALWMGVPTITLPGEIFASRHSASHLSNAGLADWVTDSQRRYVEMAVARAADLPALARLRAGLREQVRQSPLCDAPRFGRSLGAALRHAWRAWCAEQSYRASGRYLIRCGSVASAPSRRRLSSSYAWKLPSNHSTWLSPSNARI